eukprot:2287433-Pyramimonas_sp.AAC.1
MEGGAKGYAAAPPPAPLPSEAVAPAQNREPLGGAKPSQGKPPLGRAWTWSTWRHPTKRVLRLRRSMRL